MNAYGLANCSLAKPAEQKKQQDVEKLTTKETFILEDFGDNKYFFDVFACLLIIK